MFDHLNIPNQWKHEWTKYPEGYTILEALISWVNQVNIMVDNQNDLSRKVTTFRTELDNFINQFDDDLTQTVESTLSEWQQSGYLDVVINAALQTQIDDLEAQHTQDITDVNTQLAQTETNLMSRGLNFAAPFGTSLTAPARDGVTDDTQALVDAIDYCVENKVPLIIPKYDYVISLIQLVNIDGLTIEFLEGARFLNVPNIDNDGFLSIKNSSNITIKNPHFDGRWCNSRGIRILSGNRHIRIENPIIKNISPILTETNPKNTDSLAIFISLTDNEHIYLNNVLIDGVKNNDNGILGDQLGSSRGILFSSTNTSVKSLCKNVIIDKISINNVQSEDGDAIQFQGRSGHNETVDIKVYDLTTDYCLRRALKFQFINGVLVDRVNILQSDKTVPMAAGISLLSSGNTIKNIKMDIHAVRGIELSPFQDDDFKTLIDGIQIKLENTSTIGGSQVIGIDLLDHVPGVTIDNTTIKNVDILAPNSAFVLRTFTRNLNIKGVRHKSYTGDKIAFSLSYSAGTNVAKDGSNVVHKDGSIDNVVCDVAGYYANNSTTFENFLFGKTINFDDSDPFVHLRNMTGALLIKPRIFIGANAPTSGRYRKGDYVSNPTLSVIGDTGSRYVVKGWLRITDGTSHVVGVDWIEDKLYTGA
jgi:hypothetical protein